MSRTRFSVASEKGQENLKIMATAVTKMKQLPPTNPLSWEYQAALHGTNNPALKNAKFVNSCPHYAQAGDDTSKFFLVWHRLALYYFEEAIRAVSGRQDFTLPYWDTIDINQRKIPKAFLSVENGGYASLYDPDRGKSLSDPSKPILNLNDGKTILPTSDRYDTATQKLIGAKNSGYYIFNSTIDSSPHGGPHIDIDGKMLDFKTAALEPLFWVHHCNIDRLWATYSNDAVNPLEFSRLKPGMSFGFFNQKGQPVTYSYKKAAEAMYKLDYDYDTGANTLKPANANQKPKVKQTIFNKVLDQDIISLEGSKLIARPNTRLARWTSSNARTILSLTMESCHTTAGHIDILIGGLKKNTFDAIINYKFEDLKNMNNGKFLDQYYAGVINFIPHSGGSPEATTKPHAHGAASASRKSCGDKNTYLFDITDELRASGSKPTDPLNISFNIDPDYNNFESLKTVILASAAIYNQI